MFVPMPLVMRGVPAQIFFAVPENKNWVKTNRDKEERVGLTLDHPLQVKLELDLLAGVDDVDELEEVEDKEEAKRCQRPKRPHQNFHFQPHQCPNIRIGLSEKVLNPTTAETSQKFSVKKNLPTYSSYCFLVDNNNSNHKYSKVL